MANSHDGSLDGHDWPLFEDLDKWTDHLYEGVKILADRNRDHIVQFPKRERVKDWLDDQACWELENAAELGERKQMVAHVTRNVAREVLVLS